MTKPEGTSTSVTQSAPAVLRIEITGGSAPEAATGAPRDGGLAAARVVLDYLRALAWPLVVVGLLLIYRPPLGRMATSLASKVDVASKVTVGSLSVEVAERAREVGNPSLADSIGELSEVAVRELLRTPRYGDMILLSTGSRHPDTVSYGLPDSTRVGALRDLVDKGFLRFREPLDPFLAYLRQVGTLEAEPRNEIGQTHRYYGVAVSDRQVDTNRLRNQGYSLTDQGGKAVDAITRAVASQLARKK